MNAPASAAAQTGATAKIAAPSAIMAIPGCADSRSDQKYIATTPIRQPIQSVDTSHPAVAVVSWNSRANTGNAGPKIAAPQPTMKNPITAAVSKAVLALGSGVITGSGWGPASYASPRRRVNPSGQL